ncbi:unnamed protein product [Aspergillus oryzae]|uniref:Unnamed protein product n=1 Tax=Aspergillus oryzae TaxID=5062 RepID=A0AAN5BVE3_ASPOZ|nr:unnamed protein product [Aspergillus oryzae]
MEFTRCGIHGFHEVIGMDTDEIRFFWALHADKEYARQTAYRVVVSTDRDNLQSQGVCWDSGRVESDAQRNIKCTPNQPFQSTTFHYWKVTVWDENDIPCESPVNEFYTSYPRSSGLLPPYSMNQTYVSIPSRH